MSVGKRSGVNTNCMRSERLRGPVIIPEASEYRALEGWPFWVPLQKHVSWTLTLSTKKEIERRDTASYFSQYPIFIRFEAILCLSLNWFFCSAWNLPPTSLFRTRRNAGPRGKLDVWDPSSPTGVNEGLGDRWLTSCSCDRLGRLASSLWKRNSSPD